MSPWWNEYAGDIIWVGVGLTVLIAYQIALAWCVRRNPRCTIQSVNRQARTLWVQHIMEEPSLRILAVQTLRNSTMAATFFASTAVILVIGVLNLSSEADKLAESWHTLNGIGSHHPGLRAAKFMVLLADFLVAFFSFAMSVRLYNHVGFQISLPPSSRPPGVSPEHVAKHLNRAGAFYSVGMRSYYLAVPLVFWLFGPHLMAVASLVLVAALYFIDRIAPDAAED
ncbi:DUF599 domain-containing protein [Imhoffiella purpurea]|uniref:DUF599 domain-containing protein n=1 Tax=Imhoffiella purpurea TaxID=1249627 RepID=W9VJG5_9GAMM|nr:DUF599 domain-containing protein [Imhoffiella purpurea]EXJ17146.1 hypothetical protein D779_0898 [Imhoffiella purpurea]